MNLQQSPEGDKVKRIFRECFHMIVVPVLLALFCSKVLVVNATIPSGSMENTIQPGDRVIIFRFPDDETQVYIKRVIGLPGETIRITDGRVYIDGSEKPLEEVYLKEVPQGSSGPFEVPEDSSFVLGDNRNHSHDSRYWENHYVKKEEILAKAVFRYYPRLGKVD